MTGIAHAAVGAARARLAGRRSRILLLEEQIEHITDRDGVWFAMRAAVARYIAAALGLDTAHVSAE